MRAADLATARFFHDGCRIPPPHADTRQRKSADLCCANAPGGTRVGADGKWLGALKRGTYFSASVDRGEHHLNTRAHIGLWSHLEKPATQAVRFFLHEMRLLAVDLDNALLVRTRWLGSLTVTP